MMGELKKLKQDLKITQAALLGDTARMSELAEQVRELTEENHGQAHDIEWLKNDLEELAQRVFNLED